MELIIVLHVFKTLHFKNGHRQCHELSYVKNIKRHTCVFPQRQNLLNSNKFKSYVNFIDVNLPSNTGVT
jgi:hypothetical protein